MKFHLRWIIRRDVPECMDIDQLCFPNPWGESDFVECQTQRNCIGMCAEDADDRIVGFMYYELYPKRLHLLNFAVLPAMQRKGVGTAMVAKLLAKLNQQRRTRIELGIRESNLDGQLFFKAMGFKAFKVVRDAFSDTDESAYLMRYQLKKPAKKAVEAA